MESVAGLPTRQTSSTFAATLDNKLGGYEAILSKQKYIAGDVSPRLISPELSTVVRGSDAPYRRSALLISSTCHTPRSLQIPGTDTWKTQSKRLNIARYVYVAWDFAPFALMCHA